MNGVITMVAGVLLMFVGAFQWKCTDKLDPRNLIDTQSIVTGRISAIGYVVFGAVVFLFPVVEWLFG